MSFLVIHDEDSTWEVFATEEEARQYIDGRIRNVDEDDDLNGMQLLKLLATVVETQDGLVLKEEQDAETKNPA